MFVMRIGVACLIIGAPFSVHSCYELYNSQGQNIYRSELPPFDLSYPDESPERISSKNNGQHLIISKPPCVLEREIKPIRTKGVLASRPGRMPQYGGGGSLAGLDGYSGSGPLPFSALSTGQADIGASGGGDSYSRGAIDPYTAKQYVGTPAGVIDPSNSLVMPRTGPNQFFNVETGQFMNLQER